jgi:hypothetical protein
MDKRIISLIGVGVVVIAGVIGFLVLKPKTTASTPSPAPSSDLTVEELPKENPNQQKCESIISPQSLSDFSGQQFTFSKEMTGYAADFSCFYTTIAGPGSHIVDAKIVTDPEKVEFEAAKSAGSNVTKEAGLGDDAYFSNTTYNPSENPEWSLHVTQGGKTYIVDLYQYKSETETKALMKDIFTKLTTI